jgi:hypothetical protein
MRQMVEPQFDEDLKVLSHLRGYPEDLRHYSNLIKQSHPRGMSALRHVLNRPVAAKSLIGAVCRYVAEGIPIASAIEAAELFGIPPRQFLNHTAERPDFPAPLFAAEDRRVWRLADLEAYRARQPAADI